MNRKVLFYLLFLSACDMQSTNGNAVIFNPPILTDQSWQVSYQGTGKSGARVCVATAGELEVTWRGTETQVARSSSMNPGDIYRVTIAAHTYETRDAWFSPADSRRIVQDFLTGGIVYTELQNLDIEGRIEHTHRDSNKIPLQGFNAVYQKCTRYVGAK